MIFGNDESRNGWFAKEDELPSIVISRDIIPISATEIRDDIKRNSKELFLKHTNPAIHKYFDLLKFILNESE
jgi:hypothetical protein